MSCYQNFVKVFRQQQQQQHLDAGKRGVIYVSLLVHVARFMVDIVVARGAK